MSLFDEVDKTILNTIQSDFPMVSNPYHIIAQDIGLDENEVITRLVKLKEQGIIRRIGGNFGPDKVGFISTLCAAQVPNDKIDVFAETVNAYPGVTHNYQRDHKFNVWFTFIAPSMEEIEKNLQEISKKTGINNILNLPATKRFKIRAHFYL